MPNLVKQWKGKRGLVASICLFLYAPDKYNFLPVCFGLDMRHQGASEKLFQLLNFLGVTNVKKSTHAKSDGFDKEGVLWKTLIEV